MALIRGAYGGGQIKGSISGTTYQQGPYGTVARNRTVPVNPNTVRQQRSRNAVAYCSNEWFNILTAAERAAWEQYAQDTPWLNKFGDTVLLPGRQHFLRRATVEYSIQTLLAIPIAITPDAPSAPGLPPQMALTLACDVSAGTLDITALTPALIAGETAIVEYGINISPTKNYYTGPFQLTSVMVGVQTPPVSLIAGGTFTLGYQAIARVRWIDANGRTATAAFCRTTNVA